MRLKALAKINLGLDVLGKREDGYHEVRMVMQTIQMYDIINIYKSSRPGIHLQTNLPYIPTDERNLVYRAADLLMKEFDIKTGLQISLEKFIPVSAGMAGGSSDAAAALIAVNRLFHLELSKKELMQRGLAIGADVPYCIMRGTALAEGIGEKLTELPPAPSCYVLIGKPPVSVSTRQAYGSLRLCDVARRPDIDRLIKAIGDNDLGAMVPHMENVFEPGITAEYPVIGKIKDLMLESGAVHAMMTGSGPTVFGIFRSRAAAGKAANVLRKSQLARTVFTTRLFNTTERGCEKNLNTNSR